MGGRKAVFKIADSAVRPSLLQGSRAGLAWVAAGHPWHASAAHLDEKPVGDALRAEARHRGPNCHLRGRAGGAGTPASGVNSGREEAHALCWELHGRLCSDAANFRAQRWVEWLRTQLLHCP